MDSAFPLCVQQAALRDMAWPEALHGGQTGGPCTLPAPGRAALNLHPVSTSASRAPESCVLSAADTKPKLFTQAARESAHQLADQCFHKPQSSDAASLLLNPGASSPVTLISWPPFGVRRFSLCPEASRLGSSEQRHSPSRLTPPQTSH